MDRIKFIGCFIAATMVLTSSMTQVCTNLSTVSNMKTNTIYAASLSDSALGFASAAGVTGGDFSSEKAYVKVSNADELVTALSSSSRKSGVKVIEITGDIDLGYNMISTSAKSSDSGLTPASQPLTHPTLKKTGVSQLKISDFEGLTIFSSNGAKIKHGCLVFSKCSNVKIQNLEFDELWEWDEKDKGNYDTNDWDYMTLKGCSGFWVDHCTFHKAYDGVIDSKDGTTGLTISWSRFLSGDPNNIFYKAAFDEMETNISEYPMYGYLRQTAGLTKDQIMKVASPQKKTHLVGATEFNQTNNNLEITLCYNYYSNSQDRLPRLRGGNAHVYNIVVDSADAYYAGKIISSENANKIKSAGYHFTVTSQAFVSTENGSLYVQDSIIKGVKSPQKNNQKSSDKPEYTGKMIISNSYYECGDLKYTGSSTDKDAPDAIKPVPAPTKEFSWNKTPNLTGENIPYPVKLYSLQELENVLLSNCGTSKTFVGTDIPSVTIPIITTTTADNKLTTTSIISATSVYPQTDITSTLINDTDNKIMYGDIDENRCVDISDLTLMSLTLLGDYNFTQKQEKAADVTGDGTFNLSDLAHLKQYIMKDDVVLGPAIV